MKATHSDVKVIRGIFETTPDDYPFLGMLLDYIDQLEAQLENLREIRPLQ